MNLRSDKTLEGRKEVLSIKKKMRDRLATIVNSDEYKTFKQEEKSIIRNLAALSGFKHKDL
jgi:hypothetical protein